MIIVIVTIFVIIIIIINIITTTVITITLIDVIINTIIIIIIITKNYDNLLYLMNEIKTLRFRSTVSILYEPLIITASIIKYT